MNGRTYKSDPTIMAWDLMNEPRCTGCAAAVQTWIATMAAFLKSIDTNHMVGSQKKCSARWHLRSISVLRGQPQRQVELTTPGMLRTALLRPAYSCAANRRRRRRCRSAVRSDSSSTRRTNSISNSHATASFTAK